MSKATKLSSVSWKAKSYLADVELLSREVEHTYFRLLQGIYLSQNQFPDDDAKAARFCKCKSVKEYRAHKAELLLPRGIDPETGLEISPRIYVFSGKIRSEKCDEQLGHASKLRAQKSGAGTASAEKKKTAKSLKEPKTGSTGVTTAGATARTTANSTEQSTADPTAGALPLTLNPSVDKSTESIDQSNSRAKGKSPRQRGMTAKQAEIDAAFERWWLKYPHKVSKGAGRIAYLRAWKKVDGNEALLITAVEAYARVRDGEDHKYTKHPSTWLNSESWADNADPNSLPPSPDGTPTSAIPVIVPGQGPALQVAMAKKYLMHFDQPHPMDPIRFLRPRKRGERAFWPYQHPATGEPFPRPGEPGCPVSEEALIQAVAELQAEHPDVAWPLPHRSDAARGAA